MCNGIKSNQTKLNGYIRRMFSLDQILMDPEDTSNFRTQEEMMEQLRPYNNLIKSIGALQYTTKYMQNHVPVIFRAWKEMVFEKKAKRLHVLLSSGSNNASELDNLNAANTSGVDYNNQSRILSTSAEMQHRAGGGHSQMNQWKDQRDVVVGE